MTAISNYEKEMTETNEYLKLMSLSMPEGYVPQEVFKDLKNLVDFYDNPIFECDFVRACNFYKSLKPIFGVPIAFQEIEQIFGDAKFLCNIPTFRGKNIKDIIFDPVSAMMFGICRVMENKK